MDGVFLFVSEKNGGGEAEQAGRRLLVPSDLQVLDPGQVGQTVIFADVPCQIVRTILSQFKNWQDR